MGKLLKSMANLLTYSNIKFISSPKKFSSSPAQTAIFAKFSKHSTVRVKSRISVMGQ